MHSVSKCSSLAQLGSRRHAVTGMVGGELHRRGSTICTDFLGGGNTLLGCVGDGRGGGKAFIGFQCGLCNVKLDYVLQSNKDVWYNPLGVECEDG